MSAKKLSGFFQLQESEMSRPILSYRVANSISTGKVSLTE